MKKSIIVLSVAFLIFVANPVYPAEYIVKKGDTLTRVAEITGHTTEQLIAMNNLESDKPLVVGQRIIFVSKEDVANAMLWFYEEIEATRVKTGLILPSHEESQRIKTLRKLLKDTGELNIRYYPVYYDEDLAEGIYYKTILQRADVWKNWKDYRH